MKTLEPWVPHPVSAMRYWVHHILPLVYDDSLSYYEVLAKVSAKMNEVIENLNDMDGQLKEMTDFINENFEELRNDFETFKEYMEGKQDAFEEEMKQMQKAFEELITGQFDAFKQTMLEMQQAFEAKLTKQQQDFENEITEQQSNFESTLTQKEQQFETKITEQQNAFEQTLTEKENTFEQSMDTKYQTFVSTVTSQLTEYQKLWEAYKDEIDGKISDFEGEVNTNFSQLQSTLEASIQQWETETEGKLDTKFNEYKTNADGDIANWEADAEEQLNTQFGTLSAEVMQKLADMIVQETGEQTDKVPSQKAWTDRAFIERTFPSVGDDYDFASAFFEPGYYPSPAQNSTNWTHFPDELKGSGYAMLAFPSGSSSQSVLLWSSAVNCVYYVWFGANGSPYREYKLYPQKAGSSVNVVQTQGSSETDVMSQKAVTEGLPKFVRDLTNEDDISTLTTPGLYRIPKGVEPLANPYFGRGAGEAAKSYDRYVYCLFNDPQNHKGFFIATMVNTGVSDITTYTRQPEVMIGAWGENNSFLGVSYLFQWNLTQDLLSILPFFPASKTNPVSSWGAYQLTATDRGEVTSISMTDTNGPNWSGYNKDEPKFLPGLYTVKSSNVSKITPSIPNVNTAHDVLIVVLNAGINLALDRDAPTKHMTEHELILAAQVEDNKLWFGVKNRETFTWAEMPDLTWIKDNVSLYRQTAGLASTLDLTKEGVKPGFYTVPGESITEDITPQLPGADTGSAAFVCVLNSTYDPLDSGETKAYLAVAIQPSSQKAWIGGGDGGKPFEWIAMGGDSDNPWNSSRTLATSLIQANTNTASDSRLVAENVLSKTLPMFRPPNVVQWGRLHPFTELQIPAGSYLVDKATFDAIPDKPSGAFSTMSEGNLLITYTTATYGYKPAVNASNPQYAHVIITAADGESNEVWIGTIKRAITPERNAANWIKVSNE